MVENITGIKTAQTFYDLIAYNNYITGGLFMGFFLVSIFFIITFVLMRRSEPREAIWVSSFLCFMFSLMLGVLKMVNSKFTIGFLIVFILMTIYQVIMKRNVG